MIYPKFSTKYIAFTQYFSSKHQAVDIANSVTVGNKKYKNTYLYMAHEGKVVKNEYASDYGNFLEYEVKDGNDTWLFASGHMAVKSKLEVGKTYPQGTLIGEMNGVGTNSTGFHDHFRVTKNGVRVDPLKYVYVYPDQVVGTKETATLKYYTPITPSVARDTNKDQIKTLKYVNVRAGAGTNQTILGQVDAGNIYNFTETKSSGEYTWYKIAEGQWIAQDKANTYLEVLLKEETQETNNETNAELEELKKQNQELIDGNALLTKQNEDLKQQIEELRQELIETETYKQLFQIEKTAKYKIKLNEGERLYIK